MGYKVIIGKKTKRSGQKTVEEKYRWLTNNGYSPEQYSERPKWQLRNGEVEPSVKEINDAFKYFKKERR